MALSLGLSLLTGFSWIFRFSVIDRAVLQIPLADEYVRGLHTKTWLGVIGVVLLALVTNIVAGKLGCDAMWTWVYTAGTFFALGAVLFWWYTNSTLQSTQMTPSFILLEGAHPDYLAHLPEWPTYFTESPTR
jgi:hypothetical protein